MRPSGGQGGRSTASECRAEGSVSHGGEPGFGGWKGERRVRAGGWRLRSSIRYWGAWMHWWVSRETLDSILSGTGSSAEVWGWGWYDRIYAPSSGSWQGWRRAEPPLTGLWNLKPWNLPFPRFKGTVQLWISFTGGFCSPWMSFLILFLFIYFAIWITVGQTPTRWSVVQRVLHLEDSLLPQLSLYWIAFQFKVYLNVFMSSLVMDI